MDDFFLLYSVRDPPFDDKDISLVLYCAVTNCIQMDLFERLLNGIGAGLDLSIPALHRYIMYMYIIMWV